MKTLYLNYEDAVKAIAKQNFEVDNWRDEPQSWCEIGEAMLDEARILLDKWGENYLPDEDYNKAHPGNEHAHIILAK